MTDGRRTRRLRIAAAIVAALGVAGLIYLALSDDPAARYAYDTIDAPRNRPLRGVDTARDRARDRAAGERLARELEARAGTPPDDAAAGGGTARFLTRAGLDGALEEVRREGDRLVSLLVTPEHVDAVVIGEDGTVRAVRVSATGTEVEDQGDGPPEPVPLPSVADLDPAVPARLARSAGAAAVSATVTNAGSRARWAVTLDDGRTVIGDASVAPSPGR